MPRIPLRHKVRDEDCVVLKDDVEFIFRRCLLCSVWKVVRYSHHSPYPLSPVTLVEGYGGLSCKAVVIAKDHDLSRGEEDEVAMVGRNSCRPQAAVESAGPRARPRPCTRSRQHRQATQRLTPRHLYYCAMGNNSTQGSCVLDRRCAGTA